MSPHRRHDARGTRDVDHHPLLEAGFIDWVVSTVRTCITTRTSAWPLDASGRPFADDVELREEGVVRIYDIFFDYEVLLSTDAYIREVSAGPDSSAP